MRRTFNRLITLLAGRTRTNYTARSPRAPQDQPEGSPARMRRWFTTGEIRRNRRESW